MAEVFKEYLVKQQKSSTDFLAQVGIIVGAVVLAVLAFMFGGAFLGPLLVVAIVFGAAFLFSRFSKEYEYILTNNELDIDIIYNRARRKRVVTLDIKKIDVMASIKDDMRQADINKKTEKIINASENTNKANTYAIVTTTSTMGACKVLITPSETFLNDLYRQAPNKVFKKL